MRRRAQPWLGTLVDISIASPGDDAAFTSAFAQIALVHRLMGFHDPASDVSRINRAQAGDSVPVDPHTFFVLKLALEVAQASQGLFNIACAPQLVLWGHLPAGNGSPPPYVPEQPVVRLGGNDKVTKLAEGWIDLGGIAKGYAVDLAIKALQAAGVASACVNAGGDLRVFGDEAYPVAIRAAGDPSRIATQVLLRDEAMASSATYFSIQKHAGQHSSALVNGRSGQALVERVSASVRASTCVVADALTKVVLASRNPQHPALALFQASAVYGHQA